MQSPRTELEILIHWLLATRPCICRQDETSTHKSEHGDDGITLYINEMVGRLAISLRH